MPKKTMTPTGANLKFAKEMKGIFGEYRTTWLCPIMLSINKVCLDVCELDKYLQNRFKYDEGTDISMRDYVAEKYGEQAMEKIQRWVKGEQAFQKK